jgi:hypothetical protein
MAGKRKDRKSEIEKEYSSSKTNILKDNLKVAFWIKCFIGLMKVCYLTRKQRVV